MTRDDEFDDFLRRRKPIFRREDDDGLEPPPEIDRLVLRQAREAIEPEQPQRVFRAPRWSAPIALAATILVALSVVFHMGMPAKAPVGEVTVQNISREIAAPPPPAAESREAPGEAAVSADAPAREQVAENGAVVVDLAPSEKAEMARSQRSAQARTSGSEVAAATPPAPPPPFVADAEASRYAEPVPAAPGAAPQRAEMETANAQARADASSATLAKSAAAPAWRRDSKTWLAEIERLRAAGETAKADAEMAEYKRQQRAFAGAPDR
jgi:hypothetical protein